MKKKIFILLTAILTFSLLIVSCNSTQVGSPNYNYDFKGYLDYEFTTEISSQETSSFNFKYPQGWTIEESPFRPALENAEASPDWGVDIYQKDDKENIIYIFTSFSPRNLANEEDFEKNEFIVDGHKKGDMYTFISEDTIDIYILYAKSTVNYQNARLTMEIDFYKQHKEEIWHILASVEY